MPFAVRRVATLSLIVVLPMSAVAGCANIPRALVILPACADLVPDRWKEGVKAPPIYSAEPTISDVMIYADAATARIDMANDRTSDTMSIIEACEKQNAKSAEKLRPKPWWRFGL